MDLLYKDKAIKTRHCKQCKVQIPPDEEHLTYHSPGGQGWYPVTSYYCCTCSLKLLTKEIAELKRLSEKQKKIRVWLKQYMKDHKDIKGRYILNKARRK